MGWGRCASRLLAAGAGDIGFRSKVGEGSVRSMEGESIGVESAGEKTSWDLFGLRWKRGDVGEAGVDFLRPALRKPPGLLDMLDGVAHDSS